MVMDKLYIESLELHIASLRLEIQELNHSIDDSRQMIEIREKQRIISANRLNQASTLLDEYLKENGSPS